jgi:DNA polymerase-1
LQTLMGDATDNYQGIKGVGIKTAEKMLEKDGYTWDTVVACYEKAGLTEDDALMNARLAYILQHQDVDHTTKTIKQLWTPPHVKE